MEMWSARLFSGSDCEFVEPQTFSLARKRKVCFAESREQMKIDETPVEAPPAARRKGTVPTPQQSPPPQPEGTKSPSEEITMEMEDREHCRRGMDHGGRASVDSTRQSSYGGNGGVPGQE